MKVDLTIIIAHYFSENSQHLNPLFKTIDTIFEQKNNYNIEVIIADDGSDYSSKIVNNYSKKIEIKDDPRDIFIAEEDILRNFLKNQNIKHSLNKWVYLPKTIQCMSKARVANYAVQESNSDKILFLDDDNYFISKNSIESLIELFKEYNIIVGQIKDNNGRVREYSSNRVQGTTIAISKKVFMNVNGFGEWTEQYSCGVDSDFWIKLYSYFKSSGKINACFTNKISTFDSCSKRWGKFTSIFRNYKIKKEFYRRYNCKNYKSKKYNLSRQKQLWLKNLVND